MRQVALYLEMFVLMNDDPDHTWMLTFLHHGVNIEAAGG